MRAADLGYAPRFLTFFVAWSFFRFGGESTLPPQAANASRWAQKGRCLNVVTFFVMMFSTLSLERNTNGEKMTQTVAQKASIPNPALEPFRVLIGNWNTTGRHGSVSDTILHGRT